MFLVIWGNVLTRLASLIPCWIYVRAADDIMLSPLNFENHDACVIYGSIVALDRTSIRERKWELGSIYYKSRDITSAFE